MPAYCGRKRADPPAAPHVMLSNFPSHTVPEHEFLDLTGVSLPHKGRYHQFQYTKNGSGMQHNMRVTDDSVEVVVQREFYSNSIGSSTPAGVIDEIVAFSEDAKTPDRYSEHEYWYEMPEKDGLEEKVREIADMWSKVGDRGALPEGRLIDTSARTKRTSSEPRNMSADLLAR